jgi:catechol 2,3-dioxygenase
MSTPQVSPLAPASLPATLRLGTVHLTVSDLDRSVAYYQDTAGLRQHRREDGSAALGTGGEDLLVLHEDPAARAPGRHAGLFHVALLYPTRLELSRTARRIATSRIPISGASDHGVSEALYLRDPDGNGVELYVDRDPSVWPAPAAGTAEKVGMFTRALDVEDLLRVSDGEEVHRHAGAGLVVGHLHLHVGSIPEAVAYYRDVVGFEEMTTYPGASFLAAGGYHHHLAVNTWAGEGVGPAPDHVAGLREWTVVLADDAEVDAVGRRLEAAGATVLRLDGQGLLTFDPWGIALRISPASR